MQTTKGQKQSRGEDAEMMQEDDAPKEPEQKQQKIHGWDDDADAEMIGFMMEIENLAPLLG